MVSNPKGADMLRLRRGLRGKGFLRGKLGTAAPRHDRLESGDVQWLTKQT